MGSELDALLAEVLADPDSLGLIMHGSRAGDEGREDSDYDLVWVLTDEGRARQPEFHVRRGRADIVYQGIGHLREIADRPGWFTAGFLGAQVLADRTGEVAEVVADIVRKAGERARAELPEHYDSYLNSWLRSLKAWRRGDDLGGRLHAADSALRLVKALFALEGRWPPYLDRLEPELPGLERAQGWPEGYLGRVLRELLQTGDPRLQQEVEARVEELMRSRGIEHQWGDDLESWKT